MSRRCRIARNVFTISTLLGLILGRAAFAETPNFMMELTLNGEQIEGRPLDWSKERVMFLARDGQLHEFHPSRAKNFRKTATRFESYSSSRFRKELLRELGPGFEVTSTGHYIVAHAAGERDRWGKRFEDLYRSFLRYFRVRGFQVDEPPVPLVAVVLRNQDEFMRYAAMHGEHVTTGVLGFYSPTSNRVALYDLGAGRNTQAAWHETAGTIIHEATHQTAFNTGIHSRLLQPPYWVAEGLGTMFEAKGIWDSSTFRDPTDRINRGRLADFRRYAKTRRGAGTLAETVSSDSMFRTKPMSAYAEAWALTYWLNETRPRQYGEYLKRTVARAGVEEYSSQDRIADFTAVFGEDLKMLEAHFLRFMSEVK